MQYQVLTRSRRAVATGRSLRPVGILWFLVPFRENCFCKIGGGIKRTDWVRVCSRRVALAAHKRLFVLLLKRYAP
jgi:hypothetical protein